MSLVTMRASGSRYRLGKVCNQWPIAGVPDVTFFNRHRPRARSHWRAGLVQSIDPRTGVNTQVMTGAGAHTTALAAPGPAVRVLPSHGGVLALAGA